MAHYHFFDCRCNLPISFVKFIHKFKFGNLLPPVGFIIFGLVQRHGKHQHCAGSSRSLLQNSVHQQIKPGNPGYPAISAQSVGNPGHLIVRPVGFPSLPRDKFGFIMDSNGINTNGLNLSNPGAFVNYHFCILHFYSNVITTNFGILLLVIVFYQ